MTITLRTDVFATHVDGVLVFLDLGRDRYCALDRSWSERALRVIADGADDDELRERLVRAHLTGGNAEKPFALTKGRSPQTELAGSDVAARPGAVVRAVWSRMRAARELKRCRIGDIVGARRAQRARSRESAGVRAGARESVLAQARAFRSLQAFSPRDGACLENALALLGFLGPLGAGAEWVFAVKGAPFSAHCWVQLEDIVLNDALANTQGYAPILVV